MSPPSRWLYGPFRDLLFGCGLGYLGLLAVFAVTGPSIQSVLPAPLLLMLLSLPHYGATLLRAYETREERHKYWLFTVHSTLGLIALYAFGVHSVLVGSLLVTIYLTWSPWHYTGQNFGIAMMFLRRRGVAVDPATRRALYLSFVLSYGMVFLASHGRLNPDASYAPGMDGGGGNYTFMALGIPRGFALPCVAVVGAAYAAAFGTALVRLLRVAALRDLGPTLLTALMQSMWFVLPFVAGTTAFGETAVGRALQAQSTPYGFILLVAVGHVVQYLWVTAYYARAAGEAGRFLPFYGKALLAGSGVWLVPSVIFAPNLFGRFHYEAGLSLLTAAMVNLHHFVLDGAIWKLRDGRIARFLVRNTGEGGAAQPASGARRSGLVRKAAWATCAATFLFMGAVRYENQVGFERALAGDDLARAQTAVDRLSWVGRDGVGHHLALAQSLRQRGELDAALSEVEKSLDISSTFEGLRMLGRLREQRGENAAAAAAYDEAVALRPDDARMLLRLGRTQLALGDLARAEEALARAAELEPSDPEIAGALQEMRASGRLPER